MMNTKPQQLSHLLGSSCLNDLLKDATKVAEIGLDWIDDAPLGFLADDLEQTSEGPVPFMRAMAKMCRAELRRRDRAYQGKRAEPVFFQIDHQVPRDFLEFTVAYCSNQVLKWRRLAASSGAAPECSMQVALVWYLAACAVTEQFRAALSKKH